jgi:hypothetical protein
VGDTNYLRYLQNTIKNMVEVEQWGALCVDESTLSQEEVNKLPETLQPHAVFVVTPAGAHCDNQFSGRLIRSMSLLKNHQLLRFKRSKNSGVS